MKSAPIYIFFKEKLSHLKNNNVLGYISRAKNLPRTACHHWNKVDHGLLSYPLL